MAGYVFALVMQLWGMWLGVLMHESGLMGGLFVFFAFGGETGLINENEGDI